MSLSTASNYLSLAYFIAIAAISRNNFLLRSVNVHLFTYFSIQGFNIVTVLLSPLSLTFCFHSITTSSASSGSTTVAPQLQIQSASQPTAPAPLFPTI